jgi:membrane protease YdiL (CAAX protease family)
VAGPLWRLPLGYGLGAGLGVFLVVKAEGLDLTALRRRLFPEGSSFAQWFLGLGVLALGFLLATVVAWVLSPLLRGSPPPQKDLMDLLSTAKGAGPALLLFATVAVMAPCFEEFLIRGFLLPWMRERWGWGRALVASSLIFGALHLQPTALGPLSALGLALGLGVWRTGSLRASIAAHALWNGGIFLLMRTLVRA